MMRHVWANYESRAFGMDEITPVSGRGVDNWGSLGMTLVDSLDTLWLMGFREEFDRAAGWVEQNLSYDKDVNVNLFETTIRQLGGLLAAYTLSGRRRLLEKAVDLGDRLLRAFPSAEARVVRPAPQKKTAAGAAVGLLEDLLRRIGLPHEDIGGLLGAETDAAVPEGLPGFTSEQFSDTAQGAMLPFSDINLLTGERQNLAGFVSLAEAYVPTEWKALALFTGNCSYATPQDEVLRVVNRSLVLEERGLAPILLKADGTPFPSPENRISLGSRGDSFYEYLLKDAIFSDAGPKAPTRRLWKAFRDALPALFVQATPAEAHAALAAKSRAARRKSGQQARRRHGRRRRAAGGGQGGEQAPAPAPSEARRGAGGAQGGWFESWRDVRDPWLFLREVGFSRSVPKMDHLVCFLPGALALEVLHQRGAWEKLTSLKVGGKVRVRPEAAAVLAASRRAGLAGAKDHKRLAALGKTVRVLKKDLNDTTVLCSVPEVGDVWFASDALVQTEARQVGGGDAVGNVTAMHEAHLSQLLMAHKLLRTCVHMYFRTASDLAPEITRFNAFGLTDDLGSMHHILRPETIESVFVMWRTTRAQLYRNWGQRLLSAFARTKTAYGYASLHDVNRPDDLRDGMPSFFVAETVKYLFLLFSDEAVLPLDRYVLGTEAHPLPTVESSGLHWPCGPKGRPPNASAAPGRAEQPPPKRPAPVARQDAQAAGNASTAPAPPLACSNAGSPRTCAVGEQATGEATAAALEREVAALRTELEAARARELALEASARALEAELARCRSAAPRELEAIVAEPALPAPPPPAPRPVPEQGGGNPACWSGGFTFEACCLPPPDGNPECWDGYFTHALCCASGDSGLP